MILPQRDRRCDGTPPLRQQSSCISRNDAAEARSFGVSTGPSATIARCPSRTNVLANSDHSARCGAVRLAARMADERRRIIRIGFGDGDR